MNNGDRRSSPGRPFRFLLLVLLLWGGSRMATIIGWRAGPSTTMAGRPLKAAKIAWKRSANAKPAILLTLAIVNSMSQPRGDVGTAAYVQMQAHSELPPPEPTDAVITTVDKVADHGASASEGAYILAALPTGSSPNDRWAASAWLFWRAGSGGSQLASSGQLGGSQVGMRLDHDLSPTNRSRVALYGRLSGALNQPRGAESALGVAFQPKRAVPITIAVERRIALDQNGRNAVAMFAYGGIGPTRISHDFQVEGYGQAGFVGLQKGDAFADGKLTLSHKPGWHDFAVGLGVSGGAQPRLSRLDIGPQIETRVPLGERSARLVAEWRYKVAGSALPDSGLAITLAMDF